jgi:predicted lactoylglutathione lyase
MQKVTPMIHVPDVRAAAEWYESIGFEVVFTHSDDGEMSGALLSFGTTEIMFNEGGRPSDAYRREVDLYVQVDDAINSTTD